MAPAGRFPATMPVAVVGLFLLVGQCFCQGKNEQVYIIIRPKVLVLREKSVEENVQVICRQLPLSSSDSGASLRIDRTPRKAGSGSELLAELTTRSSAARVPNSKNIATGDVDKQLTLTMTAATCKDALYTYRCRSVLSNSRNKTAKATFTVTTPPVRLTIRPRPMREVYLKAARVTLTCGSKDTVVGIQGDQGGEPRWVWQYNDVGAWQPVISTNVSGGRVYGSGDCFLKSTPTSLKVDVKDFESCSRRFRCYIQHGVDKSADNAKEFLVSKGFDCNEGFRVLGTDPFVAIVGVLAVVAVFCILAYVLFMVSSGIRKRQKDEQERQIELRILSPMTTAQRDRLLKEKMGKSPTENPASVTQETTSEAHSEAAGKSTESATDMPSALVEASEYGEESEATEREAEATEKKTKSTGKDKEAAEKEAGDEEGGEDKGKKQKNKKKKTTNIMLIMDPHEESEFETDASSTVGDAPSVADDVSVSEA